MMRKKRKAFSQRLVGSCSVGNECEATYMLMGNLNSCHFTKSFPVHSLYGAVIYSAVTERGMQKGKSLVYYVS